jgi:hypothetical protein
MKTLMPYVWPTVALAAIGALLTVNPRRVPVVAIEAPRGPPIFFAIDAEVVSDPASHDAYIAATLNGPFAEVLWIDREAAQKWRSEIDRAAKVSGLSPGVIAELVGMESGFRNVANPTSSAFGFGQQIRANAIMRVCRLDRTVPGESILGAALELRWHLDRTGSMAKALDAYGTTARLSPDLRRHVLDRIQRASTRF